MKNYIDFIIMKEKKWASKRKQKNKKFDRDY